MPLENCDRSGFRIFALPRNSLDSLHRSQPGNENSRILGRNRKFPPSKQKYSLLNSLQQGIQARWNPTAFIARWISWLRMNTFHTPSSRRFSAVSSAIP